MPAVESIAYPELIAYLLATYLFGAIPTGYIVAKKLKGIDIREHGSGNTGATNVKRVVGNKAGLFVLIFDFFKGFLPVLIFPFLFPGQEWIRILVALMAMLGHSRSVFLKFTGGKSAITGLGCVLALEPVVGLLAGLLAFLLVKLTRLVSLATLSAALAAPLMMLLFGSDMSHVIFAALGGLYVFYLHRGNIVRLIQGTENRI